MIDFGPLNDIVLATFGDDEDGEPTVVIRRTGQPDLTVEAIYDSRHYQVALGEEGASELVTAVTLGTAHANLVTVEQTRIIARGIIYKATDKRPDGQGFVTLPLERA